MPEIINWLEMEMDNNRRIVPWLILESMVRKGESITKTWPDLDATKMTVELIINGIPVPVVETLNKLEDNLGKVIDEKAKELFLQKINDLGYLIDDYTNGLKKELLKKFNWEDTE